MANVATFSEDKKMSYRERLLIILAAAGFVFDTNAGYFINQSSGEWFKVYDDYYVRKEPLEHLPKKVSYKECYNDLGELLNAHSISFEYPFGNFKFDAKILIEQLKLSHYTDDNVLFTPKDSNGIRVVVYEQYFVMTNVRIVKYPKYVYHYACTIVGHSASHCDSGIMTYDERILGIDQYDTLKKDIVQIADEMDELPEGCDYDNCTVNIVSLSLLHTINNADEDA